MIRRGDAWKLVQKEARPGDLVIFDPDYIREQGRKVAGYEVTAEDKELKTFLEKFNRIVLPKSQEGVKFIVTNTWDEDLARALKERGFEIYKVNRRSHGKNIKSELVATNFRRASQTMDTADASFGVVRGSQEARARFSERGGPDKSAVDYGR
ncbi:hypothetical protein [Thermosulfurimonas sp. F29]|uniref:hypothetical protein n=1 Tax=Thermosulfurimonas sp. F29 TaxID=2867247 RepID=UPI001C8318CD|nr:hypothetical protein [Thermosulfurimonas sp. F29]MBX6423894.1 hypothetical protein [Thermosulfurimonas sp. F29]